MGRPRNYAYASTRLDYDHIIETHPLLSADEEWALAEEMCLYRGTPRGLRARDKLVLHNMRYIIRVAHQCRLVEKHVVDYDGLINQAVYYFCQALDRFDTSRGSRVRILSYAASHLLHRLIRYVTSNRHAKLLTTSLDVPSVDGDTFDRSVFDKKADMLENLRQAYDFEPMRQAIRDAVVQTVTDGQSAKMSLPVTLYRIDNLTATRQEIADHFNLNDRTVRRALSRNYKKIKPILQEVL